MECSRRSAPLPLVIALLVLAPSSTAQAAGSLFESLPSACEDAQKDLTEFAAQPLQAPEACTPKAGESTVNVDSCRSALRMQVQQAVAENLEQAFPEIRSKLLEAMDGRSFQETRALYQQVEEVLDRLAEEVKARAELTIDAEIGTFDPGTEGQAGKASEAASRIAGKAIDGFERRCRQELFDKLGSTMELMLLRESSEDQYLASLNKQDGFSRVVRCQWVRGSEEIDQLDCTPDLEVSGHDISVIEVLPPAKASDFRLAWVQAISAEESAAYKPARGRGPSQEREIMACPFVSEGDWDRRSLACDELCFGSSAPCPTAARRTLVSRTAQIAVHLPRLWNTTYGCARGSNIKCAVRSLRGHGPGEPERAKLSLVTRGHSPIIHVRAMDDKGNLAEGHILVGYERWRVESGGFLGISWNAIDRELVTEPASADGAGGDDGMGDDGNGETPPEETANQVMVTDIRDADDYSQETGIFVNLIPKNYEWLGVSLGFATSDGSAPSLYLGPTIRLTSFGNRGVAALSFGAVMRQVDRFPDIRIGETYAEDSALLQPDDRFAVDGYVAIQLGFSFGPIGSAENGDD